MKNLKTTIRERIRSEAVKAALRLYSEENYKRWGVNKIYPDQIRAAYKLAYGKLAEAHPQMTWLKTMMSTPSKDIELKLVLRVPGKDIEIDLPGGNDRKLSAIAHAGGKDLLLELLEIIMDLKC